MMTKNSPGPATQQVAKLIKKRLNELGLSPFQAARKAGLPDDSIRTVINGNAPSIDRLHEIGEALDIDLSDVFKKAHNEDADNNIAVGDTEQLFNVVHDNQSMLKEILSRLPEKKSNKVSEPIASYDAHHILVFEADAAAGGSAFNENEQVISYVAFRPDWLKKHGLDPKQCSIIRVNGDSMEPTLPHRSAVLVDRNRRRRHAGHIYVIRSDDVLLVKRLTKDRAGNWQLVSDNPEWNNMPFPNDAEVIGEVRWLGKTFT